jgi:hypothetical protein
MTSFLQYLHAKRILSKTMNRLMNDPAAKRGIAFQPWGTTSPKEPLAIQKNTVTGRHYSG